MTAVNDLIDELTHLPLRLLAQQVLAQLLIVELLDRPLRGVEVNRIPIIFHMLVCQLIGTDNLRAWRILYLYIIAGKTQSGHILRIDVPIGTVRAHLTRLSRHGIALRIHNLEGLVSWQDLMVDIGFR